MKWSRGLHHLRNLADQCTRLPAGIIPLRVTELWTYGEFVDEPADVEWVQVALSVDMPAEDVPWLSKPRGADHWSNSAKLREPLTAVWRSAHAPVWNHAIVRPVLLWSTKDGVLEEAFSALEQHKVDDVRLPEPTAEQLRARVGEELAISLRATRDRVEVYEEKRWAPGKLEPYADDLWAVTKGYLDLLDAKGPR